MAAPKTAIPGDHMSSARVGLPEGAQVVHLDEFAMESGETLINVPVAYTTYGTLAADGANAVPAAEREGEVRGERILAPRLG